MKITFKWINVNIICTPLTSSIVILDIVRVTRCQVVNDPHTHFSLNNKNIFYLKIIYTDIPYLSIDSNCKIYTSNCEKGVMYYTLIEWSIDL